MLRSILIVAAVCVTVALAASSVRLLPWLASDVVPLRVSLVFAEALALAAVEVALVVAPAVGVALELARCTSEGTTTALFCAGAGPVRQVASIAMAASFAGVMCLAASATWGWHSARPGVLSNDLIEAGRPACPDGGLSQSPLLGVSWLCLGARPQLVGTWGAGAWTAARLRLSDDLVSASLDDVTAWSREPAVHAHFGRATISGLVPWTVASTLSGPARGLAFALAAIASAVAAGWSLLRRPTHSLAVSLLAGAAGPVAFLIAAPSLFERGWVAALAGSAIVAGAAPWLASAAFGRLRLPVLRRGGTNS
jgi:hypothetical protein